MHSTHGMNSSGYFIPALSAGWGEEQPGLLILLLCPHQSAAAAAEPAGPCSQHLPGFTCPISPAQAHLPHLTCSTPPAPSHLLSPTCSISPAQPHLPHLCPISPAQLPAGAKSTAGKARLRPQEQSSLSQQWLGQRNQGIFLSQGSQTAPSFDPGHRAGCWLFSFPSLCCSLLFFSFRL